MDETYAQDIDTRAGDPGHSTAKTAVHEAGTVATTAGDQVKRVAAEAGEQTRNVAADLRTHLTNEARTQHDRLADGLRQFAGELDRMAGQGGDSPARSVVARLAESGHEAADYLGKHGPDEVLDEVRDFARRRPGAFLATAAVTGFVLGRLGRAIFDTGSDSSGDGVSRDSGSRTPDSRIPDSSIPGSGIPGSRVSGSSAPGSRVSGSSAPGSSVPGSSAWGASAPAPAEQPRAIPVTTANQSGAGPASGPGVAPTGGGPA
ncbi:MAG: hypothetical protein HOV83_21485 [Catenulispora sp.]|nr:hypothetical protein [Catenulispora sp.]